MGDGKEARTGRRVLVGGDIVPMWRAADDFQKGRVRQIWGDFVDDFQQADTGFLVLSAGFQRDGGVQGVRDERRLAGIGAGQIVVNEWSVSAGGHARTGLEDNVRLDRETLAPSNAALVRRVTELCEKYERPVATWAEARDMLGLRQPVAA
jgi:hypothetical protein